MDKKEGKSPISFNIFVLLFIGISLLYGGYTLGSSSAASASLNVKPAASSQYAATSKVISDYEKMAAIEQSLPDPTPSPSLLPSGCPANGALITWNTYVEWQKGEEYPDNNTPYNVCDAGSPWCAYFVGWVYNKAGFNLPRTIGGSRKLYDWFKEYHQTTAEPSKACPGDVVIWEKQGSSYKGHTGIVIKVNKEAGYIVTIEGNDTGSTIKRRVYTFDQIRNRNGTRFSLEGFGRW